MKTLKYKSVMARQLFLFTFVLLVSLTSIAQVSPSERQALIDLYNATNGDEWTNTTKGDRPWLINDPNSLVSDWYGVSVHENKVVRIDLLRNNLRGQIPFSIGDFPELHTLILRNNTLTGSIPNTIGNLTSLETLNIFGSGLTGTIPESIGNLLELYKLDLSSNNLTGSIPTGIDGLTKLREVILSRNNLSGVIPTNIGNLSNLRVLRLEANSISGTIPFSIGNLNSVTEISLHFNQLSGTIPTSLGNLTSVVRIALSGNKLTGSIPSSLGNLGTLEALHLNNNLLTGSIPNSLSGISGLKFLGLFDNQLSGAIPALNNLTNQLSIQSNYFVFSDFENEFSTYQTTLQTGFQYSPQAKVDEEVTLTVAENDAIILTSTDLTSNNNSYQWFKDGVAISGATNKEYVISSATSSDAGIYHFTATNNVVTGLILERNTITLTVTGDTCGVSEEEKQALIDLYNATDGPNWKNNTNWLTDAPVCDWHGVLVDQGKVLSLSLNYNNLSGLIPASIGDFPYIEFLSLIGNQLDSSIPLEIGQLTTLKRLYLGSNSFSGSFIGSIENLINLEDLNLSGNQLSGNIPSELGNLTSLTKIFLSANDFTGSIPSSLGNLNKLFHLEVSNNNLEGGIPESFKNLNSLQVLRVQNNALEGVIPEEMKDLPNFTGINVSNNRFVFSDIEALNVVFAQSPKNGYSPQAKVDQTETLSVTENGAITLTSTALTSANNSYQWYKDGVAISGGNK